MASTVLQVSALFEPANTVLRNPELLGHPDLGQLSRFAQFTQRHFFGDQLGRPCLHFLAACRTQAHDEVVHVPSLGMRYLRSCLNRARCASQRSSALRSKAR